MDAICVSDVLEQTQIPEDAEATINDYKDYQPPDTNGVFFHSKIVTLNAVAEKPAAAPPCLLEINGNGILTSVKCQLYGQWVDALCVSISQIPEKGSQISEPPIQVR